MHFLDNAMTIASIYTWIISTHQFIKYKCVLKEELMAEVA